MNWAISAVLFMMLAWTLWPNGLSALSWSAGHTIGHRLAKRAFGQPTVEFDHPVDDAEPSPKPDDPMQTGS